MSHHAKSRRRRAVESFQSAAATIGPIEKDMALFAVTRGQFSMIDVILHCLDELGPARVSVWTWRLASYELDVFRGLANDSRLTDARLIIDHSATVQHGQSGNMPEHVAAWRARFGAASVRTVVNHAKIATIEADGFKLLARGSMNLNFNPRFEQFDITEGGEDFDLVRRIEDELPAIEATKSQARRNTKIEKAFDQQTLAMFSGLKTWGK